MRVPTVQADRTLLAGQAELCLEMASKQRSPPTHTHTACLQSTLTPALAAAMAAAWLAATSAFLILTSVFLLCSLSRPISSSIDSTSPVRLRQWWK